MTDLIKIAAQALCLHDLVETETLISDEQLMHSALLYEEPARRALSAIEEAGYKIVPVEPTEEMLKASSRSDANRAGVYYRAMLAAAPKVVS